MISEIVNGLYVGDDVDAKDFWLTQQTHVSIDLTGWNIDLEQRKGTLKTVDQVIPVIKSAYDNNLPTLVYCHAGMDRSPFMVACFIHRELGFTPDYAYNLVKEGRPQTVIHDDWMRLYQSSGETANE